MEDVDSGSRERGELRNEYHTKRFLVIVLWIISFPLVKLVDNLAIV